MTHENMLAVLHLGPRQIGYELREEENGTWIATTEVVFSERNHRYFDADTAPWSTRLDEIILLHGVGRTPDEAVDDLETKLQ